MLLFTLWYPLTKAMGNDLNGDRGVFHADGKSSSNRAGKKCPRLGCRALPTVLGGRAGKTVEGFLHSYCAGTRYPMMLHKAPPESLLFWSTEQVGVSPALTQIRPASVPVKLPPPC